MYATLMPDTLASSLSWLSSVLQLGELMSAPGLVALSLQVHNHHLLQLCTNLPLNVYMRSHILSQASFFHDFLHDGSHLRW